VFANVCACCRKADHDRENKEKRHRRPAPESRHRQPRLPQGAGGYRAHPHATPLRRLRPHAEYKDANVVIVNTCGFLDSAKKESLEAIGEAMDKNGKVIVTGCMGAEPEQIMKEYPTSSPSPARSNTKKSSPPSHTRRQGPARAVSSTSSRRRACA